MSTARAQIIRSFGDASRFEAVELSLSTRPQAGAARVAVAAVSVNPVDLSTREGRNIPQSDARFPMVLGWDLAGVVTGIGDGVTAVAVGDRVAAMTFQPVDQNGTYRSVLDLDAHLLAPVPRALSLSTAATVPLVGLTASQIVDRTGASDGDVMLVNAPLGAVGRFVVQLAAARGVRVAGVVAPARAEEARTLGVTIVVPRGAGAPELLAALPGPVDVGVDLVGGAAARATIGTVRDGGVYVTAVPPYIDAGGPFDAVRGIDLHLQVVHPDRGRLAALLDLVAGGAISSPVDRELPLAEVATAHRLQAAGGLCGKLVMVP